ncbi:hypothetical protein COCSUDRAFT_83509 [Coccomyxa subellipsoidea C-169]|uniref:NTF2-domain-containing protein n=1 Tax=Coccomyxa subellipsoidea (strain C-169) TaxID=574566 RepID=I0YTK1_COCSC|nr:hypothetical protein COCSUDRAFT_83509 [Coccomyxa subellipsoidea C-169]EIE21720.1 hypothetical protein COCSUDRAFT_83509 [Coccomyxa subellipsoidea C-169]|eukprot:XP_005646264.1 hypothetical protein COCSUDRAFT_83509 [Coccomyxa subellipsoidea C-169]
MTHSDGGYDGKPGRIFTVQNQKNIHEKVLELDFEEAVTEIWSVDSQYSAHDGVIVQVTGSLQCKGKPQRNFVQTFFLAVQEKGYYVLNDIFRYLRSAPQATPLPAPATVSPVPAPLENGYASAPPSNQVRALDARPLAAAAPATPPAPAQIPHMPVSAPSATVAPAHAAPSATPAPSAPAPVQPAQPVEPVHEAPAVSPPEPVPEPEEPAAEWPNPTEPEEEPEPEPEPQPEEAPTPQQPAAPSVPLTYAERLMANTNKQNTAAPSARPQPSAAPAAAHAPAPTQTNPKPTAPAPYNGIPNGNHHTENGYYSRDELPGTSVFVRNLPQDVTEEKLEAAFKEIGALRGAKPVNLKIQKGKESFAFVDFQDSTAQQAAIAGPVLVDGHQVTVVEKKPQFIKSRGRGPGPVRGGFRGGRDGGRGGRGDGGRTGPGGRFLERGASIGSERSESARGGRRGGRGGREGGPPGAGRAPRGRGEGRGERPAPAVAAA